MKKNRENNKNSYLYFSLFIMTACTKKTVWGVIGISIFLIILFLCCLIISRLIRILLVILWISSKKEIIEIIHKFYQQLKEEPFCFSDGTKSIISVSSGLAWYNKEEAEFGKLMG